MKSLGYIELTATEIKKKIKAEFLIDGKLCYQTQTRKVAEYYAKKLSKEGFKMKVYEVVLVESK